MTALTKLATNEVWARAGFTPMRRALRGAASPWNIDRDAHGRIEVCDVGRVRLARIRANPLCVEHPRPAAGEDADRYRILLQVSGVSVLRQARREVVLSAGDWTLYEGARPFSLANLERAEQRIVILPRSELWGGTLDLDALTVRRFGARDRSSKQLVNVLDSAFELACAYGAAAATELASVAVHLSRLALIENGGDGIHPQHSAVMRQRVKDHIERNLRDPALCLACIASALSCSKRYVHKVFAEENESVAEYILKCRIERCRMALERFDARRASIADIAYSFGFKSLSHFGKVFSARYGMTPTQFRQLAWRNHLPSQPVPAL
jgi:AraC-like DNA-binding protein